KPVNILNSKVFYELNTVINRKIKTLSYAGLGECNGADDLTINEVEQILEHPTMQCTSSEGLLHCISFYNSILLALYNGEHQDLLISNFVKRFNGGINVKLYRSKTNQRGLNNSDTQAETISLPSIKSIIADYKCYFIKHSVSAVTYFYLKLFNQDD
ncbi:2085_t:CDS:1, partial [Cetraspora pellucida]